jgi:DNA (cytosine-5)-methyltransferase 1
MVPQFVRAISEVRPQAFVMENVPGLVTSKYRSYFDWVLQELEDVGYSCAWKVLNAADYGVPQSRKRVIIVGLRQGGFRFPAPTHGPDGNKPYIKSSDILANEPLGEPAKSPVMYAPIVDLRPNPYHGHVYKGGGRPIDPDRPCQTIYASAGGNKTHWVDTEGVVPAYWAHLRGGGEPREGVVPGARRLSVEESALIQSFPETLVFQGSRSSQYTQVGDAVPPLLGAAIGEALRDQLCGIDGRALMAGEPVQQAMLSVSR